MDISRFDFELDEIVGLIPKVAAISQIIELEPRLHSSDEVALHPGEDKPRALHGARTEPTYRVSLQLSGSDGTISQLADLAIETGVEAVLDFGRSVRLRHMHDRDATSATETNGA